MESVLPSSSSRRLGELRRDLTLQLFLQFGSFYDAVRTLREKWGIVAEAQLPPPIGPRIYLPSDHPPNVAVGQEGYEAWSDYAHKFWGDLRSLHDHVVPECYRYAGLEYSRSGWEKFLAACLCYDPPEVDLLPFVECGGRYLQGIIDPRKEHMFAGRDDAPYMEAPPVKYLQDARAVEEDRDLFWVRVLNEIADRHLVPLGLDLGMMLNDVLRNTPELWQESAERRKQNPAIPYIAVGEQTTHDDVANAFKMIAHELPARPAAQRPGRDRLTAVQCAIWHDRHQWSHVRIAEHFGWTISLDDYGNPRRSEAARMHVQLGRMILRHEKSTG